MKLKPKKAVKVSKAVKHASAAVLTPPAIKSILVPIDFSSHSKKSLVYAASMAKAFKGKLTLLHVVEPVPAPDFSKAFPLAIENEQIILAARSQLQRTLEESRIPRGMVDELVVVFGRSFDEITTMAHRRKADLIIISTHGYTGLKHVLLGSTTERVVRHASCPVLVLRQS